LAGHIGGGASQLVVHVTGEICHASQVEVVAVSDGPVAYQQWRTESRGNYAHTQGRQEL